MMIWRKTRLVKKYIWNNIRQEILDELTARNDTVGIRYSRNLNHEPNNANNENDVNPIDKDLQIKEEINQKLEYTWQQALFKIIDDRLIDEVELYKKSGITKQTFSKIRSDEKYHPDKDTAICLCIGLELSLIDTQTLLEKAGFTLSKSIERDLVFMYFIENEEYNIYTIDCVLKKLKMKLLLNY